MTKFSTLTGALIFLALTASGGKVAFDLDSNGSYWWGGAWTHTPDGGNTSNCICVKGIRLDNRRPDAVCFSGIGYNRDDYGNFFMRATIDVVKEIPFDGNRPIDITTDGTDGLWMDRVRFETNAGTRWYGANNSAGWCLSKDRDDEFDKWSTHGGCHQSLSFNPNGHVYAYGYYRYNVDTKAKCAAVRGRRRAEGSADVNVALQASVGEPNNVGSHYHDADPTGEHPNQVRGSDALVVGTLHQKIREMVRDNSDVTDGQIDSILNSAMLDVEHILERREHEGEVLDFADGSEGKEPNNRNVQERLQGLEEMEPSAQDSEN